MFLGLELQPNEAMFFNAYMIHQSSITASWEIHFHWSRIFEKCQVYFRDSTLRGNIWLLNHSVTSNSNSQHQILPVTSPPIRGARAEAVKGKTNCASSIQSLGLPYLLSLPSKTMFFISDVLLSGIKFFSADIAIHLIFTLFNGCQSIQKSRYS